LGDVVVDGLTVIKHDKRDEVTGSWTKLHNEELHKLYSLLVIVRMIKSRRIKWARHVARMRSSEMRREFRLERLKGINYLEDVSEMK
jgi:hypothetical protein